MEARSPARKAMSIREILESPEGQAAAAQWTELVRLATPLYIEMLCSLPFYEALRNDKHFWSSYIGSRVTSARQLVADSLGEPFQGQMPRSK